MGTIASIDGRAIFSGYPALLDLYERWLVSPEPELHLRVRMPISWREEFWKDDELTLEVTFETKVCPFGEDVVMDFRITPRGMLRLVRLLDRLGSEAALIIDYCCSIHVVRAANDEQGR